jgi:hypothetical protein
MKNVASLDMELTVEERNLLSVAYKNVIGNFFIILSFIVCIRIMLLGHCVSLVIDKFLVYIKGLQQYLRVFFSYGIIFCNERQLNHLKYEFAKLNSFMS